MQHRVFISYHHANDQQYKDLLLWENSQHNIFTDMSVDTGDISDDCNDDYIRTTIRDDYLRNSTVTILLVGTETKNRKHIDWEIYSSMIDGKKNKKSGILVVNLPTMRCPYITAAHGDEEKNLIYPEYNQWSNITRQDFCDRYPYMPERIIDNLTTGQSYISVTTWDKVFNHPENLRKLIEWTFQDKDRCQYDLTKPMRRRNS